MFYKRERQQKIIVNISTLLIIFQSKFYIFVSLQLSKNKEQKVNEKSCYFTTLLEPRDAFMGTTHIL